MCLFWLCFLHGFCYTYTHMAKSSSKTNSNRARTYARNRTVVSRRGFEKVSETDGTYFLKLVIFLLLATLWLKFESPVEWLGVPINALPLGIVLGLILVHLVEKYQFNRKIWYAVLLTVGIISYFVPAGIII